MKHVLLPLSSLSLILFIFNGCTAAPTNNSTFPPIFPHPTDTNKPKENPHTEIQQQLQQAEKKWQQQANKHYIYTIQRSCFCPPEARKPMRVRVKDNTIVQVLLVPENITKPVNYGGALSVDGLFNLIQKAIDSHAASIKATYDAQYGYPTSISIDQDRRMADEEIYYKASGMRLL